MKKVTITLKQANANLTVSKTVDSELLSEIAGTLIFNINQVRVKAKKYNLDLGGFSFNRKFEIEIAVDEQKGTLNQILGQETIAFSTTLTKNTFVNFSNMVMNLIEGLLTGANAEIVDFSELFVVGKN